MRIETRAIVVANRPHGEHGAVARFLTPDHGLQSGYIRGARGRGLRPVLLSGNDVQLTLTSRVESQLAQASVELLHSRASIFNEPLPAAAIDWVTALTAKVLPEGQAYPRIFEALHGLLSAIEAAPSARGWGAALVRYELLMLAELGFGLDLGQCAVSGKSQDLAAVSPRSGRAISRSEAGPYAGRLLVLPNFLIDGGIGQWPEIADGLKLTGHFIMRDLITDHASPVAECRARLVGRLHKAAGLA